MKIRDFLMKFNKWLHKTQSYKTTMSNDRLACSFLKAANFDAKHEKLSEATVFDLIYDEVRSKLIKIFSDESPGTTNDMEIVRIKDEPIFYRNDRFNSWW